MATIYDQIALKIRELRQSFPGGPLSQEGLASKLKKPANTVSRWETCVYKPTAEDLEKMARLFSVPISVFFPDMPDQKSEAAMLTSALSGLNRKDLEEVARYAEYRKARRLLDDSNKKPIKNRG